MKIKHRIAPSVLKASRAALHQTSFLLRAARERLTHLTRELAAAKVEVDLHELEVRQLESFLRDAGIDETEIKNLKGEK